MAEKKLKKLSGKKKTAGTSKSKNILDQANQIWLAGLGAFARAQEEGEKIFDTLVSEGRSLESKGRKMTEATVNEVRDNVEDTVEGVQGRAARGWDKLEQVFEDRVARTLGALGVPTANDIRSLTERVEELQKAVDALKKSKGATASKATSKKKKAPARKAAANKAPARKKTAKKKAAKKTLRKKTSRKS